MFIDEIYSYGLSNSSGKAFLNKNNEMQNKWVNSNYFDDYLSVNDNQKFDYNSVYNNQVKDVHPPLYYAILHTVCSFFPNSYSKWLGESINIIFFAVTQIFLFALARKIFNNNLILSLSTILLYGGTMLAIDNATYIRMYMLLAMFAVMSYYFHYVALYSEKLLFYLPPIMIVTYLGCLTQYYFLILSFFIAFVFCIILFCKKEFKFCLAYGLGMLTTVVAFYFTFPAVIEHLFGGRTVGYRTLENARNIRTLFIKAFNYLMSTLSAMVGNFANIFLILLVLISITSIIFIVLKRNKEKTINCYAPNAGNLLVVVSVLLTFFVVALIAFDTYPRYLYYIYPIIALIVIMFFHSAGNVIFSSNKYVPLILIFTIFVSCCTYLFRTSSYMYEKVYENEQCLEEYRECYGVVFVKDNSTAAVTQETLSLKQLKGVYCTDDSKASNVSEFLENKDTDKGIVVWVDVDSYWSSGYDSNIVIKEILDNSSFSKSDLLYEYGLVEVYHVY